MTRLDVTGVEDVPRGLLAEKSTSATLPDWEPEAPREPETQESGSQGTLRKRPKGELVAAHGCSSSVARPTLPVGIRTVVG